VITLSSALADYLDWPGQQQAFQLVRSRTNRKTGAVQAETIYGLTSLSAAKADATYVLARVRNHWIIENGSHYVRDVTFHEDHSQVRAGSTPQVLAALRNVAIALHRLHGETNMASACRRTAAKEHAGDHRESPDVYASLALPLGGAALISYEALWRRGREVNMPPDTQCRLRLNYPLTVRIPW